MEIKVLKLQKVISKITLKTWSNLRKIPLGEVFSHFLNFFEGVRVTIFVK